MKLVSPKTLLASLLGCAFVVIKVMRFDGFPDLFWIIFIGYMSIKGLVTAFSQEAYDEDVKQAQYGKVFYSRLSLKSEGFSFCTREIAFFPCNAHFKPLIFRAVLHGK